MSLFDTLIIQEYIQPPAQTSVVAIRHDRRLNKLNGTARLRSTITYLVGELHPCLGNQQKGAPQDFIERTPRCPCSSTRIVNSAPLNRRTAVPLRIFPVTFSRFCF